MFFSILYIFLFLIFLSILLAVHEAGHLIAAKAFNVYCFEYALGFGPNLISRKRKNGETKFSIKAIPFGGFVSMYGEGMGLPEGVEIPKERSLQGIKKWKRAIIMVAGVTMNALLALVFFFTSEIAFQQKQIYINQVNVAESSISAEAGFENGDLINIFTEEYEESIKASTLKDELKNIMVVDKDTIINYKDSTTGNAVTVMYLASLQDFDHISLHSYTAFFPKDGDEVKWDNQILNFNEIESFSVQYTTYVYNQDKEPVLKPTNRVDFKVGIEDAKYYIQDVGLTFFIHKYWNNFGQAVGKTFKDFGDSSTAIIGGVISLFTDKNAGQNMGGIIAIGFETTNILKTFGFGKFLYIWGMISVNLAILNLVPFPGLDGWQLLVLFVEAVAHREIPSKVKGIVSFVGIALLFVLMVVLVFKDMFKYII